MEGAHHRQPARWMDSISGVYGREQSYSLFSCPLGDVRSTESTRVGRVCQECHVPRSNIPFTIGRTLRLRRTPVARVIVGR